MKPSRAELLLFESILLLVFISVNLGLLGWLTGWNLLLGSIMIALLAICYGLYNQSLGWLLCWGINASLLGMLVGAIVDFGAADIRLLYELCSQGGMLSIAPATTLGMILGCNLGLLHTGVKGHVASLVICNVGMLLGMVLFVWVSGVWTLTHPSLVVVLHLTSMLAGAELLNRLWRCYVETQQDKCFQLSKNKKSRLGNFTL